MTRGETAAGDETTSEEALTVRSPEQNHEEFDPESGQGQGATSGSGAGQTGNGGGRGGRRRAKKNKKKGSFWRELPILLVVALGLALLIKTFLVQAFYIPSESMENTLVPGDRVLVNKLSYEFGDIQRGDVVVFNGADSWAPEVAPSEPDNVLQRGLQSVGELFGFVPLGEKDFIKRVVGLPGDEVACCDDEGLLTVNGQSVQESEYLFPGDAPSTTTFERTVPEGHLWMMGDHRSASADSRLHTGDPGGGAVPMDHVIGRAFVIVWPLDRISLLDQPDAFTEAGVASAAEPAEPAEPAEDVSSRDQTVAAEPRVGDTSTLAVAGVLPLLGLAGWMERRRRRGRRGPFRRSRV